MNILVTDFQSVSDVSAQVTQMIQQGPVSSLVTLTNNGVNTITYIWQENIDGVWTNLGALGTDYYNTLVAGQVKSIKVESDYSQVRLMGSASGGSTITFGVLRYFVRQDGGQIPILAF